MTHRYQPPAAAVQDALEGSVNPNRREEAAATRVAAEGGAEVTKKADKKAKTAKKAASATPGSAGRVRLTDDERRHRATERSKRWYAANPGKAAEYRQRMREKKLAESEAAGEAAKPKPRIISK